MNMYLQYSDAEGMGMGGGGAEGSFGLFIGEDFLSGSTGRWAFFCVCVLLSSCSSSDFSVPCSALFCESGFPRNAIPNPI